jgi:hypothetical protein
MDENSQLILTLGRVEGKIDSIIQAQCRLEDRLDGHEKRLGTLERWQAKVLGMGAVAGSLASFAWQYITSGVH